MDTRTLIGDLQRTLGLQIEAVEELRSMSLELLQQRPSPKRWSVMEVIEHMNLSSGVYYRGLKDLYSKPNSKLRFSPTYSPGKLGAFSTKAMRPGYEGKISWRMKTMGMFEPRTAATKGWKALDEFQDMLRGMIALLEQAKKKGVEGEKVTSSLGPILRFKPGDAFTFPIAHQERHMLQIEKTIGELNTSMDKTIHSA